MPERSGFFDAKVLEDGSYDRVYLSDSFAKYFASFVGNGVFAKKLSGLQVISDSGMSIKVRPGQAWINGYWYENDSDLSLQIATAPATGYRVDSVVIQYSATNRIIQCVVKQGAANTSNPAPTRDGEYYELVLAYIKVSAGNVQISQSMIVDKRADTSVCGFVAALINQIDTSEFCTQLEQWIADYMDKTDKEYTSFLEYIAQKKGLADEKLETFNGDIDSLKSEAVQDINALIDELKGLLDGDVAANLQKQVDDRLLKPTEQQLVGISKTDQFYPLIGYDSKGNPDTTNVKAMPTLLASVGRVLMKVEEGKANVIQLADFKSTYYQVGDESQKVYNPYEEDKKNASLNPTTQYLVPGNLYGGPECLVDAATWERLQYYNYCGISLENSAQLEAMKGTWVSFQGSEGLLTASQGDRISFKPNSEGYIVSFWKKGENLSNESGDNFAIYKIKQPDNISLVKGNNFINIEFLSFENNLYRYWFTNNSDSNVGFVATKIENMVEFAQG